MFSEHDYIRIDRIFSEVQPGTPLEKGMLIDAFDYGSKFSITKSGKYIKEKLALHKTTLENDVRDCKSQCSSLLSQAPKGVIPTDEPSSYVFEGIRKSAFIDYPKMFSWKIVESYYPEKRQQSAYPTMNGINDATNSTPKVHTYDILEQYNNCARKCIKTMADLIWLNTLMETLDDKQQIELNGRMLKLLA